jgi:ABC-type nitrate/sulfonate/bicarbonate transport system permease component
VKAVSSSPESADLQPQTDAPVRAAPGAVAAPVLRLVRRRFSLSGFVVAVSSIIIPLALWWGLAALVTHLRGVPFPTPHETFGRLLGLLRGRLLLDFTIYRHLDDSLRRWAIGFGLAMMIGIASGLLLGWSRLLERLSMPTVTVLQLIPGLAWIPVAILLFGIGERATIFMIAATALAPVIINTTAGVKGVSEHLVRAARMMGADNRTLFVRVLLPGSLPHLLSGIRVGFANAWRVLVAAEMVVGTGTGLGYSIIQARWTLDYPASFVCIAIICAFGLLVERGLLLPLERRTVDRWGLARTT